MVVKHDVNFLDSSDTSLQITIVTLKVKQIMVLISPIQILHTFCNKITYCDRTLACSVVVTPSGLQWSSISAVLWNCSMDLAVNSARLVMADKWASYENENSTVRTNTNIHYSKIHVGTSQKSFSTFQAK